MVCNLNQINVVAKLNIENEIHNTEILYMMHKPEIYLKTHGFGIGGYINVQVLFFKSTY